MAWVEAHTLSPGVPEESPAVRSVRVRVAAGEPAGGGSLTVRSVGGAVTERTIGGPTCAEVAEALAVMVAVADRSARGDGRGRRRGAASSEDRGGGARARTPSRPPRPSLPSVRPAPAPAAARWPRFAVDLRVETTSAVFRGALAGMGASLTVEPPAPPPRRGVYVSVPSVAAGVRRSFPMERALRGGSVDFAWTAGHLRL
ncbi:MAG: hypothetical protein KIS78_21875 [Labilithrix sp.]|nr:hypothetical protein [Labilithrix sp.]